MPASLLSIGKSCVIDDCYACGYWIGVEEGKWKYTGARVRCAAKKTIDRSTAAFLTLVSLCLSVCLFPPSFRYLYDNAVPQISYSRGVDVGSFRPEAVNRSTFHYDDGRPTTFDQQKRDEQEKEKEDSGSSSSSSSRKTRDVEIVEIVEEAAAAENSPIPYSCRSLTNMMAMPSMLEVCANMAPYITGRGFFQPPPSPPRLGDVVMTIDNGVMTT